MSNDERKFHTPTFLDTDKIKILPTQLYGSSVVKAFINEDISSNAGTGKEIKTPEFYIKEIPKMGASVIWSIPAYYSKTSRLESVAHTSIKLSENGKPADIQKLIAYYSDEKKTRGLYLKEGETVESAVTEAVHLIKPETILAHIKKLYEWHRARYNSKIPGFVIDKLFVLGEDESGAQHGYILKFHVPSVTDNPPSFLDLDSIVGSSRSAPQEEQEGGILDFVTELQKRLSPEQLKTLKKDLKNFVLITRKIMTDEGLCIDFAGGHDNTNIRITPEGHLRMIDTDRVYPAKMGDGRPDTAAENNEKTLEALEFLAKSILPKR